MEIAGWAHNSWVNLGSGGGTYVLYTFRTSVAWCMNH